MTDAEKYQFILNNDIELFSNSTTYTDVHGNKYKPKYTVAINNTGYCGYDLDEAIELAYASAPKCPICNNILEESCMGTWTCPIHWYDFE